MSNEKQRIIVCDSGLGGLNIASAYFSSARKEEKEEKEIIYFNAFPDKDLGFNDLTVSDQEKMLKNVLEGMKKFSPDLCLIACNTVSIILERLLKWYTPAFAVEGIVDIAVKGMKDFLTKEDPASHVLILGTKSTVQSNVYTSRLLEAGIEERRVHSLGCPGVAKSLESGPATEKVRALIESFAANSPELPAGAKCALAFCCTHFAYAEEIWKKAFAEKWGYVPVILNPNESMAQMVTGKGCSFQYVSRIGLFDGAKENMPSVFMKDAPQIAEALKNVQEDPALFSIAIS